MWNLKEFWTIKKILKGKKEDLHSKIHNLLPGNSRKGIYANEIKLRVHK